MTQRWKTFLSLAMLASLVLPMVWQILSKALPKGVASWEIAEWLISYDAGLIRRGLSGQLIETISLGTGVAPSVIAVLLSLLIFLLLVGLVLRLFRESIPVYVLFSPLLLGAPVFSNFLIRKDTFTVLAFAVSFLMLASARPLLLRMLVANALSIVAILFHEAYVFAALPLLILHVSKGGGLIVRLKQGVPFFLPAIATAGLVLFQKGTAAQAVQITERWNEVYRAVAPAYCCYDSPPTAIDAIGWSFQRGLGAAANILDDFSGPFYIPLMWVLTLLLAGLAIAFFKRETREGSRQVFLNFFLMQTVFVSPLFVLGLDTGRWIFMISATSFVAVSAWERRGSGIAPWMPFRELVRYVRCLPQRILPIHGLLFFILAVPGCCWSMRIYALRTPLGANYSALKSLLAYVF
ncbi:MAG: hypothetical protein AAGF79_05180 [Pseudomonadota bacterium]